MDKEAIYYWNKTILILIMAIGISRVFFLTTVMGGHFDSLAEGNRVRRVRLDPIRGIIRDRNAKHLAMNIDYGGKTVRFYPGGEVVASIVGYLGKPDEIDLKDCLDCNAEATVGKAGLEKQYQEMLLGIPGMVTAQETASGQEKMEVARIESLPGENITTNVDLELQKLAYISLKNTLKETGKSGAVVVAKVNGEVLALVSSPSFDPNLFIPDGKRSDFGGDFKDVDSLIKDTEKKPLYNRAISGDYAPGSVFKLTPAIAALEEGKINKTSMIMDTGEIKIGEYRYGNWYLDKYGKTEGEIGIVKALARSNDIFFYKLGEALGVDALVSWSEKFGLGEKSGIDLPGESNGFVPTPYWKEKNIGEKWFLGNTYHFAIGQGDLMATPLQINRMTAEVVSGLSCSPRLVGKAECLDLRLNNKNIAIVLEGMKEACSPGGTAFPLFEYAGRIYCKTGTAQKGGKESLSNAWMSVVVPKGADTKEWIVITVLIEEGGEGSAVAAPVAKEILPYILDKL
ncbi:MAG: Penicillin-binding protein 2 [Candidatus Collierbacteria bacterium GW2011_GWB1_44_6]|uniref:Penicillin-binding protein 2 n=1 Tax=Candidatus Collierbacteria bacterium GW2011_GWB1_44_6 TaxID=1618384 RepID=A0A0G1JLF5_9BACT|nr:MAG: Penicillin-binding protein 2 [Candidatus Collierbacteria bacterium GW2011_GWB1_44_6]